LTNVQDLHDWKSPSTATDGTQSFRRLATDTQNTKTVILSPNSTSILSSSSSSLRDTITQHHERNIHSLLEMPIGNWSKQDIDEANQEFYNIMQHHDNNNMDGAKQATKILHRIIDEFIEGNPYASVHINMIDEFLSIWTNVSRKHLPTQSLMLINKLQSHDEDSIPYKTFIRSLARVHTEDSASILDVLLQRMIKAEEEYNHSSTNKTESKQLATVTFNSIISCSMNLAKTGRGHMGRKQAVKTLNQMKGLYRMGNDSVKPNLLSFSMTITAVLQSMNDDLFVALETEEILQDMLHFYKNDVKNGVHDADVLKPDKQLFDVVLGALGRFCASINDVRAKIDGNKRAQNLLVDMESILGVDATDAVTYNKVLTCMLHCNSKESTNAMEELIAKMENKAESSSLPDVTYNLLIKKHVKNKDPAKAESVLRRMIQLGSEVGYEYMKPDSISWNSVIGGYATDKSQASISTAINLLQKMYEYSKSENAMAQPDKITISLIINAFIQRAKNGDKNAGQTAIQLLNHMEESYQAGNHERFKPDAMLYTKVFTCVAKSNNRDTLKTTQSLLTRIDKLYRSGRRPELKPDTILLNSALSCLSGVRNQAAAVEAEKIFQRMITSNDPDASPSVLSVSIMIDVLANSGARDTTRRIKRLLQQLESTDIELNTVAYTTYLKLLSKSKDRDALKQAMNVYNKMEESNNPKQHPNSYSFVAVMETISNSPIKGEIVDKAFDFLQRAIKKNFDASKSSDDTPNTTSRPIHLNTVCFGSTLKAIENSSEVNKSLKALDILSEMRRLYQYGYRQADPNTRTYNAVIKCCALSKGDSKDKQGAFSIASNALESIRTNDKLSPDLYTYPAFFKACEKLIGRSDADIDIIRKAFNQCCEDGLVDGLVVNNLKNFLPEIAFQSFFGISAPVRLNSLPKSWSRNIYSLPQKGRRGGRKRKNAQKIMT